MTNNEQLIIEMNNSIGSRMVHPKFFNGSVVLMVVEYPEMRPEKPEHVKVWLDAYSAAVRHGFVDC